MKMINHHHVVMVKDVFATSAKIFIVLEFVGGGELFDKIANEGKLPEEKARFYFKQLVEGLSHCHNNGVCHRDLKPEVRCPFLCLFFCSILNSSGTTSSLLTLVLTSNLHPFLPSFVIEPFAGHRRQPEDLRLWF